MTKFIQFLAASAVAVIVVAAAGAPALAQTAICGDFTGAAFGLCNAYCEAMACGSDNPQASDKACDKVMEKFNAITPTETELPCLDDGTTNTAPVVDLSGAPDDGTFDTTATFVSFGDAVPIALDVAITDDGTVITSAAIELKNPVAGENETLALTPEGLILLALLNLEAGGSSNFDSATGILLITGEGDLAQYENLILQVVYDNGDDSPAMSPVRLIEVMVSDGLIDGESNVATSALSVHVGCPCTTLTSGFFINPSVWPFFKRFFDARLPEGGGWIWTHTNRADPPNCIIRDDPTPSKRVAGFSIEWPRTSAAKWSLTSLLMAWNFVPPDGKCRVDYSNASSNMLVSGEVLVDLNELLERVNSPGFVITLEDPSVGIDVFTSDQVEACDQGISRNLAFIIEWFEARGATCIGP